MLLSSRTIKRLNEVLDANPKVYVEMEKDDHVVFLYKGEAVYIIEVSEMTSNVNDVIKGVYNAMRAVRYNELKGQEGS